MRRVIEFFEDIDFELVILALIGVAMIILTIILLVKGVNSTNASFVTLQNANSTLVLNRTIQTMLH